MHHQVMFAQWKLGKRLNIRKENRKRNERSTQDIRNFWKTATVIY